MKRSGGEAVVRALEDEGVPFAFGIPGTHNIELYDALAGAEDVRPVLVTDERSAAFMADGVWRASGRLGCVNVVPGAGLTHAFSGVAEAYLDNVPMLVLACGVRRDTGRAYQLHDVDQLAMAAPVTKEQLRQERGEEVYDAVRTACRLARDGAPGPVIVEVPAEHYLHRHESRDGRGSGLPGAPPPDPARPSVAAPPGSPRPDPGDVDRAAEILDGARRPLLYVGLGAAGAADLLPELAERLEAPVSTTFQGKGVFPESHPLWLWPGFGDAAPPFAREVAEGCDATLAVGCRFREVGTGSWGFEPPEPMVHVDVDGSVFGRNYPAELGVEADARAFVEALLARVGPKPEDADLRGRLEEGRQEARAEQMEPSGTDRVTPGLLLAELQDALRPGAVFTTDSGNGTFLALEGLRLETPGKFLAPVDYSCMGYSVPAALGAALARPDLPVVALAGDGAFLMTGLEMLTAAREAASVAALVLRDRELAQISQFQDVALNRRTASEVPDYGVEGIARAAGVGHLSLGSDEEIPEVVGELAARLGRGEPTLVDVAIDYSRKTWFTRGVVRTTLGRLPWAERLRFVGRALLRRVTG